MKLIAALLALFAVAYLALRLRPARPARVVGLERGAAVAVGRRWLVVRVQVGIRL
jgi:hypothetical protein